MPAEEFESRFFLITHHDDVIAMRIVDSHLTEEVNTEELGIDMMTAVDHYHCTKLVLDVRNIEYATSSVIGKFITLHRRLSREQGRMVMCCVDPHFGEVLKTSRLDQYFNVVDTVEQAIERVNESAE